MQLSAPRTADAHARTPWKPYTQRRSQKCELGMGSTLPSPSPFCPYFFLSVPFLLSLLLRSPSFSFSFFPPLFPLEVGPLKSSSEIWGSAVTYPAGSGAEPWRKKIESGALQLQNTRSGGNNFDYSAENRLTKLTNSVQCSLNVGLCFVWRIGGTRPQAPSCLYATAYTYTNVRTYATVRQSDRSVLVHD